MLNVSLLLVARFSLLLVVRDCDYFLLNARGRREVNFMVLPVHGWMNDRVCAWSASLPNGLVAAPYFLSPAIG